jgi:hypothetical protein
MQLTGLTLILNVSDVGASLAWFETLGWRAARVDPTARGRRAGGR